MLTEGSMLSCSDAASEKLAEGRAISYIRVTVMEISCPGKVGRQQPSRCKIDS